MLIATITTQRSGSKLLASCFNAGLEVRSLGEIFNPDARHCPGNFQQYICAYGQSLWQRSGEEVLDHFFGGIKAVISGVVHFDIMYNQIEIPCLSWNPFEVPFILGYLRSRNALVISLERDVKKSFVSAKYLEHIQKDAHVLSIEDRLTVVEGLQLDVGHFRAYRRHVLRQRALLRAAMKGYPNFYVCDYGKLSKGGRIPDELRDLVVEAASGHGMAINGNLIQVLSPKVYRTRVDYSRVFENYAEL